MPPPVNAAYGSRSASRSPSTQPLQRLDRLGGRGDPAADVGDHGVRVVAVAEQPPVDDLLHPVARGGRGQRRDRPPPARPSASRGRTRRRRTPPGRRPRPRTPVSRPKTTRPVERELDVEQPVPQHADADRDGQAAESDREPHWSPAPPNSNTMPTTRTMPPRNSHWSWVRSTSRARRIRRNRDSTAERDADEEQQGRADQGDVQRPVGALDPERVRRPAARGRRVTSETIRHRVVRQATTSTATTTLRQPRRQRSPVREQLRDHRQREEVRRREPPDRHPGRDRAEPALPVGVRGVQRGQLVGPDQRRHQHQPPDRVARPSAHHRRADHRPGDPEHHVRRLRGAERAVGAEGGGQRDRRQAARRGHPPRSRRRAGSGAGRRSADNSFTGVIVPEKASRDSGVRCPSVPGTPGAAPSSHHVNRPTATAARSNCHDPDQDPPRELHPRRRDPRRPRWPLIGAAAGLLGYVATIVLDGRTGGGADVTLTHDLFVDLNPMVYRMSMVIGYAVVVLLLVYAANWRRRVEPRLPARPPRTSCRSASSPRPRA